MDDSQFDVFVKSLTSGGSRRGALQILGGGTLAVVAARLELAEDAEAKKNRSKKAKKGDINKLCKQQVGGCIDTLLLACADDEVCVAVVQTCCQELGTCDVAGFFSCLEINAP